MSVPSLLWLIKRVFFLLLRIQFYGWNKGAYVRSLLMTSSMALHVSKPEAHDQQYGSSCVQTRSSWPAVWLFIVSTPEAHELNNPITLIKAGALAQWQTLLEAVCMFSSWFRYWVQPLSTSVTLWTCSIVSKLYPTPLTIRCSGTLHLSYQYGVRSVQTLLFYNILLNPKMVTRMCKLIQCCYTFGYQSVLMLSMNYTLDTVIRVSKPYPQ